MRKRKLAVQLYSLRNEAEKFGMEYILKAVADMGFMAVEPAGFFDYEGKPDEFLRLLKDYGLEMYSSHRPWCRIDNISETIDIAGSLGLKRVVCGYGPKDFETLDAIKKTAEDVNVMCDKLAEAGLELFQHNHYWEFERLDGQLKYDIFAELAPNVKFELDAYWSSNFGANNAAEMVARYYDRIVLLHMKDGTTQRPDAAPKMVKGIYEQRVQLRPLGEGQLNIRDILEAAPDNIDHFVVELDNSPYNQIISLYRSYQYLTSNGLGIGYK